jgi:hypothetical protein
MKEQFETVSELALPKRMWGSSKYWSNASKRHTSATRLANPGDKKVEVFNECVFGN